jgi:purine-binding chemotaxis protein CheW
MTSGTTDPAHVEPARQDLPRKPAASEQLVGFRLAAEEYAVGIAGVREIILPDRITRIPHAPDYIQGLINLRNTVVPVVDLRRRFGLPEHDATDDTRIVIVNIRGKTVGLVVDSVTEVFRAPRDEISTPPPALAGGAFLRGLLNLGERLVILLDLDRVLDEDAC